MAEATSTTDKLAEALPTDQLKEAGQKLLGLLVQRAAQVATDRVDGLADRLVDYAENGGPGLKAALSGGQALAEGKGPLRAALSGGMTGVTETVKSAFGRGGGGGAGGKKKLKVTVISEDIDIGLPLRTTYDLWTRYTDFPTFMKKVENVDQPEDGTTNWKAQVFWSHRTWEATTVEQVPDSHIVWRSKGEKGHVDGTVTFTELGPNLTRILMVLEYFPQGLFERTGNLWRAQGRRARLELQHFRRHAMRNVLIDKDEVEGWRGEIRDGEVVVSHEEAMEREEAEREEAERGPEEQEGPEAEGPEDSYAEDEYRDEDEYADEEADEGTDQEEAPYDEDDEYEEDDEYPDEDTTADRDADEYDDEADEPEPEPEPARTGRGR